MQVTVKNNQSIVDIAIEYLGSANYAVDICALNGISMTDYLEPGMNLILPEVKKTGNTPAPAVQSDVDLKNIVTQHAAKVGGASVAHVRNGGNVRIDTDGKMWVEGAHGEKGDKGDTGAQGDKGDKGDAGAQGDKGDKGDDGVPGVQGEKGDKGDDGVPGAQGIQGEKGDTGKSQYQSYLETTTDNPVLTEQQWSNQLAGVLTILQSI
jgi:hypothetical protein